MTRPPAARPPFPVATPPAARPAPPLPPEEPTAPRADRRAVRSAARARRRVLAAERRIPGPLGRRRRLLVGGAALLVLAVLLGPPLLALTPVFGVRTIEVGGASGATEQAVRAALQPQVGRPVALVSDGDVAAALRAVPAVESFVVVRRPPSTLDVRVLLRTPVAQEPDGDGWRLVDAAGVVVGTSSGRFDGVPVVALAAGASDGAFAAAVSAVRALAGADGIRIDRVTASTPDDVVVRLAGGPRVVWGGAEDGARKAQALQAALVKAADGVSTVDVSSPGVVLTR